MGYIKGYDAETLRELVDADECAQRLEELGEQRSLPSLLERVWLLKVLGRFEDALRISEQSVRVARMAGTRKDLLRSRVLHATVLQVRGSLSAAEQELVTCAEESDGQGWTPLTAFAVQHLGKVHFDAGEYTQARADFNRALRLRRESGATDEEIATLLSAIEATDRHRAQPRVAD